MQHGYFWKANSRPTSQKKHKIVTEQEGPLSCSRDGNTGGCLQPDEFSQNPDIKISSTLFKMHIGLIENPRNWFAEAGKFIYGA
jgi:hypothetical protein